MTGFAGKGLKKFEEEPTTLGATNGIGFCANTALLSNKIMNLATGLQLKMRSRIGQRTQLNFFKSSELLKGSSSNNADPLATHTVYLISSGNSSLSCHPHAVRPRPLSHMHPSGFSHPRNHSVALVRVTLMVEPCSVTPPALLSGRWLLSDVASMLLGIQISVQI